MKKTEALLKLEANSTAVPLDGEIIAVMRKHTPLEKQYDDLALFLQPAKKRKNLIRSRRQWERAQYRKAKDRIEKFERLDDLYFTLCDLCHTPFPGATLYARFRSLFKPHNVPELTLDLVDRLIHEKGSLAWDKEATYRLRAKKGLAGKVALKLGDSGRIILNLAPLWALVKLPHHYCADDYQYPQEFIETVVALNLPDLTRALIACQQMEIKTLDQIWKTCEYDLLEKIVELDEFALNINDEQAQDIIDLDDEHLLLEFSWPFLEQFGDYSDNPEPRISERLHSELRAKAIACRKKYDRSMPDDLDCDEDDLDCDEDD